jgi:hypothetical protein
MNSPDRRPRPGVLAAACVAALMAAGTASADEAQARDLLKAMTDYLAAQTTLSFDYQSNVEIVTTGDQKLMIASTGSLSMERPGSLHITRTGGFADVAAMFDGTTLTLFNASTNSYSQAPLAGDIDALITTLRDDFKRPLPAADLLRADPLAALDPIITEAADLGSGVIDGVECDHLAFRSADVDLQIWIAQGEVPHPCRFVITTKDVTGWPQYAIDFSAWGQGAAAATYTFAAPAGATRVEPSDLVDFDEIAGIYTTAGGQ